MGSEGFIEGGLSGLEPRLDEAAVHVGGSEQGDTGVSVFVVVPMEEGFAVSTGVFDGSESEEIRIDPDRRPHRRQ